MRDGKEGERDEPRAFERPCHHLFDLSVIASKLCLDVGEHVFFRNGIHCIATIAKEIESAHA